jgi:hypothetical protein
MGTQSTSDLASCFCCYFFVLSTLLPTTAPTIAPAAPPTTAPFTLSLLVVAPMTAPAAAPIAASRAPCLTVVVLAGALAVAPPEVPAVLDPLERWVLVGAVVVLRVVVVVVVVIPGAGVAAARSAAEIESRVAAFFVASDKLSADVWSALVHANAPRIAVTARRFVILILLRPEKGNGTGIGEHLPCHWRPESGGPVGQ